MSRLAGKKCFEAAGLTPGDVDVVELHDCFSANELITYEALGLCEEGKAGTVLSSVIYVFLYASGFCLGVFKTAVLSDAADLGVFKTCLKRCA